MRVFLSSLVLTLAASGLAQAGTVALIPTEAIGVEAAGRVVDGGLRAGIERTPVLTEKGPVQMSLEEARTSFSCFDENPDCMRQVGNVLTTQNLAWSQLTREGSEWNLRLVLLDVTNGRVSRTANGRIAVGPRAMEQLAAYADAFIRGQALPDFAQVAVQVTSTPSGATVSMAGRAVGKTPLSMQLAPGTYGMELSRGGAVVRREIQVVDRAVAVSVDLAETSGGGSGLSTGTWLGISTAVVAVAGVGMGTYFGMKVQDNEDEAAQLSEGNARRDVLEDEFSTNVLLTNVGWGTAIVAGAASAYFFFVHEDSGVAIAPTPGGLTVMGAF